MGNSSHSKPQPSARLTEARNSLKQRIAKKKPASNLPESLRAQVDQKKQEKKNQPSSPSSAPPVSSDPIRQQVEAKKQEKKASRNSLSQKLTNFRRKMRARGWLP